MLCSWKYVKSNSDHSKGLSIEPVLEIVDINRRNNIWFSRMGCWGRFGLRKMKKK